jgi:hypothetical protein
MAYGRLTSSASRDHRRASKGPYSTNLHGIYGRWLRSSDAADGIDYARAVSAEDPSYIIDPALTAKGS